MEEIVNLIINTPNDSDLGSQLRALYQSSPDAFNNNDKFLRLYAEFENYKKRVSNERAILVNKTKLESISSLLDFNDELYYAIKNLPANETEGLLILSDKLNSRLVAMGIMEIQTDIYDMDQHDVISAIGDDKKIVDVISKGYSIDGVIYRHPKVVLG